MKVSAVVLSYNHPIITARCVRSVLQILKNVTLVHNGSQAKNIRTLMAEFPRIDHIQIASNRGYSGGANSGLSMAFKRTDWVLFITNDCELLEFSELPGEPGIVSPYIGLRKTRYVDSVVGGVCRGRLKHLKSVDDWVQSKMDTYVPGSCFLLHRDVFEKCGGFDESYGTYWEDVDFSRRIRTAGFPIIVDPRIRVRHSVGKTCRKDPYYSLYLYYRNRRRFLKGEGDLMPRISFPEARRAWQLISQKRWAHLRYLVNALID